MSYLATVLNTPMEANSTMRYLITVLNTPMEATSTMNYLTAVPRMHATPTEANTYDATVPHDAAADNAATVPMMHNTPMEAETKIMNFRACDDKTTMNSPAATAKELGCKDMTENWPPPKPPDVAQGVSEAKAVTEKTTMMIAMIYIMMWLQKAAKKTMTMNAIMDITTWLWTAAKKTMMMNAIMDMTKWLRTDISHNATASNQKTDDNSQVTSTDAVPPSEPTRPP